MTYSDKINTAAQEILSGFAELGQIQCGASPSLDDLLGYAEIITRHNPQLEHRLDEEDNIIFYPKIKFWELVNFLMEIREDAGLYNFKIDEAQEAIYFQKDGITIFNVSVEIDARGRICDHASDEGTETFYSLEDYRNFLV